MKRNNEFSMIFCQNLKRICEYDERFKITHLEKAIERPDGHFSRIAKGHGRTTLDDAMAVSEIVGFRIEEIINGDFEETYVNDLIRKLEDEIEELKVKYGKH